MNHHRIFQPSCVLLLQLFTETFGRYHLYIRAARQYLLYQVARRAHIILKHRVTFGSLNFLLRMMQRLGAHIRRMHAIHLQADFYRIVVTYNYAKAVFKNFSGLKSLG